MTERILIEGSVDPPLLGQVHALANGIKRVGEESEKLAGAAAQGTRQLGEETAKAAQSTDRLGVSLRGVGEAARHLNEIREAAVAFGEAALGAVRGVAELAGEQQRLNANSARLRLDFAQAARGAGGFATEMQTMQLATNLANRNIRVTQSELDTLARVGMARARDAGQEVDEVFETIADSIVEGGEELGKFGQELLSVADDSHTATDRLSALVRTGRSVAPTMRTAADEVAAFESSLRSAGRYISTGFVEETARLSQLTGQTRGIRTDAEEARRELEAMGRAAAFVLRGVADLAGIVVGAVAVSVRGLTGMMQGVAEAVRTRSFDGLRTGTGGGGGRHPPDPCVHRRAGCVARGAERGRGASHDPHGRGDGGGRRGGGSGQPAQLHRDHLAGARAGPAHRAAHHPRERQRGRRWHDPQRCAPDGDRRAARGGAADDGHGARGPLRREGRDGRGDHHAHRG
jgi:hypothetical protein